MKVSVIPRLALACLVAFLFLAPTALGQETTGVIQGVVKDPTGLVVPGASVEVSGPALIGVKAMASDSAGFYRFVGLPPGEYVVKVSAPNFRNARRTSIKLEVGKALNIDFDLELGVAETIVEVQATPLIVDTTQSKAAVNISNDIIANIPKGRSFQALIEFAPGSRREPLQGAGAYQIDGASGSENVYSVEGLDTASIRTGASALDVPMEFVQEIQIKTSGFEAEYGGALGGVVNVVTKRGANAWHGGGVFYYRSDGLQASDRPTLRLNPSYSLSTALRLSEPAEYFQPKEDSWRTLEPGFDLGGFILRDRLWIFASYIPTLSRYNRTVYFDTTTPSRFVGERSYPQTNNTHFAMGRLDWRATNKIRASAAWTYAYNRWNGQLPGQDSVYGPTVQLNADRTRDPGSFRPDYGAVAPNMAMTFTGEWTPTPSFVMTARFGVWHNNSEDRGRPTGVRYVYNSTASATTLVMGATTPPIPASLYGASGFANMSSNLQTVFDVFDRTGLNVDASYFKRGLGAHTFKFGYAFNKLANNVRRAYNTAYYYVTWGSTFTPHPMGLANCAAVSTTNASQYGTGPGGQPWGCRGLYGYYTIQDGTNVLGNVGSYNHSIYVQDAWQLGEWARGVTLNLGVRFDKENLPSFKSGLLPTGGTAIANPINFGFFDKVAPRIGGAWDVFRNGKFKIYGSWGLFYDIMKYEMPRGSFGGDYWHDCTYTLETTDLSTINPVPTSRGTVCPNEGGAPGRFIEDVDWRTVSNDSSNNRVPEDLKPMRQRELVFGAEYALRADLGLDVRYARKRLDRTIEDVGVYSAAGENYYIANPGEGIVEFPLAIPGTTPECPTCPAGPKPVRNYDGLEMRLTKRWSNDWFASVSYTYSRLWGNYSGLASTDEYGRVSPNVNRFFDLPHMAFDAHGKPEYGFLNTDRPHTLKMYAAYRLKWWGMQTTFGINQQIYSGTPVSTELGIIGSGSSISYVDGRGNFVPLSRDPATGNWVAGSIEEGKRTEAFTNTDFMVTHEWKLSKTNEALRAAVEVNVSNLLNESNVLGYYQRALRTSQFSFGSPINWAYLFAGYDWVAIANNPQLVPGVGSGVRPYTLDSRYGLENRWQGPRAIRLKLKLSF